MLLQTLGICQRHIICLVIMSHATNAMHIIVRGRGKAFKLNAHKYTMAPSHTNCLYLLSWVTWNCNVTGGLLKLLNVEADERILPTTYGELRPPLGTHRLKVFWLLLASCFQSFSKALLELVCWGGASFKAWIFTRSIYRLLSFLPFYCEQVVREPSRSWSSRVLSNLF